MISDERFTKKEHLLKTKDFRNVYNNGSFIKKDPFVLYWVANDLGINRVGFSISARVVRLASRRNKMRRMIREIYRKKKKELKRGVDIIFVGKRNPGKKIEYAYIEEAFTKLINGARLLER